MDPRSFRINSEMGLVIHDRKLAGQIVGILELTWRRRIPGM
jgi:phosphatidylserine/phosphatidylglycerophosphate/cardiolipin synthase-like enzyme